ncbi:N-acetylmuramoyl-L-alanine amidase family protein [Adlercreutzia sp. ZJ138]|uniref:peptidoglycan recognition protein family protein n=1 Tax=Adlercreutzia sp. ZJ138 TaxID=2709405 RepID=UPI0013EE22E4|nr:peptidoglycan recognition family protein [Adlercreutzia sp. ZJ138]
MANYPPINRSRAQTKYNLSSKPGRQINHIVVHYTGTTAPAENNVNYFSSTNRNASADWFIDKDGSIWQFNADPRNFYSWHCGDGGGRYGISNAYSVGIEVVSAGEDFTQAQVNSLHALVVALMEDYGVPAHRVVRHYDASRKLCPAPYAGPANEQKWLNLWRTITTKEDIVTPEDINRISDAVWNKIINNEPAWAHLYWAHQDGAWSRANRTPEKTADAVWKYQIEKKDGTRQKMWAQDYQSWTNLDTARMVNTLDEILKRLDAIEKKTR